MSVLRIDYKTVIDYQLGIAHDFENGLWVNMSDINRYLVYDEAGCPLTIVDTIEQGKAELELYQWVVLNGRDPSLSVVPVFTSNTQLEYIVERFTEGDIIRFRNVHYDRRVNYIMMQKQCDRFVILSLSEVNQIRVEQNKQIVLSY